MRKAWLLTIILTGLAGSALAQWSTITLDQPYRYWHRDPDGTLFDDVLNLYPSIFTNQTFANPHIQYNDAGEWLIMGYGDNNLGSTGVGDAIYVMKRFNSGWYRVPTNPALAYAAQPGKAWPDVGGLGAGAGIAKTPTTTVGGYKYFSAVQVGKAPMINNTFSIGWTTWAVSQDGETWSFVSQSGGLTNDPALSLQLIRRSDLSGQGDKFKHIAMVYNKYDNYFYVVMGWAGACGIKGTWWRIRFDSSNAYGLPYNSSLQTYEVQVLEANSRFVNTTTTASGTVSNGLISDNFDNWQCAAQSPASTAGPSDVMDIVQLYKQDGTFDSMLFIYTPENDLSKISYVKGSLPQTSDGIFVWGTPKTLDLSSTLQNYPDGTGYSTCGAGGFMMCVNQNGWQANGAPNLFGFVSTWRTDKYLPAAHCYEQPQGLLPMHFNLN